MTSLADQARLTRITTDDAGELLTLQRSAYAEQAQLHHDPFLPPLIQTLDQVVTELDESEVTALGLRSGHRLVAAVRVRVPAGETAAQLGRLVVAPDLQGRGLGTRLLVAAERSLPDAVREVRLFTGEHSAGNLRLYARHGYLESHRSDADGYQLVHLTLTRPHAR